MKQPMKMIFDKLIADLKLLFQKRKRKSKELNQKVYEIISKVCLLYQDIFNLSPAKHLPTKHLVEQNLKNSYDSIKSLKHVEVFVSLLEWIQTILEHFLETLKEANILNEQYETFLSEFQKEYKSIINQLDTSSEEESEEEEDISKESDILYVPKILGDIKGVFSYYGRIKWFIFDKGSNFSEGSKEMLKDIGWKYIMKDVYESPVILSFEDTTLELEKVIKTIQKDINSNVEIVAAYGAIPGINIK